jgi:hypothetical protein
VVERAKAMAMARSAHVVASSAAERVEMAKKARSADCAVVEKGRRMVMDHRALVRVEMVMTAIRRVEGLAKTATSQNVRGVVEIRWRRLVLAGARPVQDQGVWAV